MKKNYKKAPPNEGGRQSNLELFRIIMMLMIIAHHYVVNSGFTELYDFEGITRNMVFLQIFGMLGKTGINCFTLITGYFMVKSAVTLQKFLSAYMEVKFYRWVIYGIFLLTGYEAFHLKTAVKTIFNVAYGAGNGYVGTYIILFLCIPFINILAGALSKKQYQYLLVLLLSYFTVLSTFFHHETWDYLGWLATVYFIGGYIRLYPNKYTNSMKAGFLCLAASIFLMCGSILTVDYIGNQMGFRGYYYMVSDAHKFLAVTCSVSAFLVFKNFNLGYNKTINTFATSTFGVLLIHASSDTMRQFLWQDLLRNVDFYQSPFLIFHAVCSVIGVYLVCVAIDNARIRFMKKPLIYLGRYLSNKLGI